jgi:hypothetical protein
MGDARRSPKRVEQRPDPLRPVKHRNDDEKLRPRSQKRRASRRGRMERRGIPSRHIIERRRSLEKGEASPANDG